MRDDNWELIDGEAAHDIEILNHENMVNVLEAAVRWLTHHFGTGPDGCPACPNQGLLRQLHSAGTFLLLQRPGDYRSCELNVNRRDGQQYLPPEASEVPRLMDGFEDDLRARWKAVSPVEAAAFALWRINWVHPFKNGNGRTARAYAYACLCLKFGFMLPGRTTLPDLIMNTRDDYEAALAAADAGFAAGGEDLSAMVTYLNSLLRLQLLSVIDGEGGASA